MNQLVSLLDNALLQGLGYGIAVLGLAISFRVLRYPDLTADGSFLLGAAAFGAILVSGLGWATAIVGSVVTGVLAGAVTALLHAGAGVNRLLSGILTTMISYSLAFRVLSGRSNLSLDSRSTPFSLAEALDAKWDGFGLSVHATSLAISLGVAAAAAFVVLGLLKSELGIVLRATGENESLISSLGRRPKYYHALGLALANGLIGLTGGLVAARQGFADVNMGVGIIITLAAALVIGEELMRLVGLNPAVSILGRVIAPVVGACLYFFLYLLVLRASILGWIPLRIRPTDLKMMSALIVVAVVLVRTHAGKQTGQRDEVLPI